MDFNSQESDMKVENVPIPDKSLDFFPKDASMKIEPVPKPNTSTDFFSQKTDKKIEEEPKKEADCFSQETDMAVEYFPTSNKLTDSFSQKMDKKIEDELTSKKAMNCIPKVPKVDLTANNSKNCFPEEIEIKVDVPTLNMSVEGFLQETSIEIEDEPIPSTSTHDPNSVYRIRKRKQRRDELSFKPYILRMKKIVTPELKLSSKALEGLDHLISNVYEIYCSELQGLFSHTQKKTLSAKDMESATKLCLPGRRKDNAMTYARNLAILKDGLM